jgi:hypothetical protein
MDLPWHRQTISCRSRQRSPWKSHVAVKKVENFRVVFPALIARASLKHCEHDDQDGLGDVFPALIARASLKPELRPQLAEIRSSLSRAHCAGLIEALPQ